MREKSKQSISADFETIQTYLHDLRYRIGSMDIASCDYIPLHVQPLFKEVMRLGAQQYVDYVENMIHDLTRNYRGSTAEYIENCIARIGHTDVYSFSVRPIEGLQDINLKKMFNVFHQGELERQTAHFVDKVRCLFIDTLRDTDRGIDTDYLRLRIGSTLDYTKEDIDRIVMGDASGARRAKDPRVEKIFRRLAQPKRV